MTGAIISYLDMCVRENTSGLQQGMNYGRGSHHSIILMSTRSNAPYRDRFENDGSTIIYEGHDATRNSIRPNPKDFDQPTKTDLGLLTQNGKFYAAAIGTKQHERSPERVRVYEKIQSGIWAYNGLFHLIDAWFEFDGTRQVCKFKLVISNEADEATFLPQIQERKRQIPSAIKQIVWRRDGGKCALCGAKDELHFDHILPFSKGGTSLTSENVQILCARHNLAKRDKIE